jgi:hypothetical protein
MAQDLLEYCVCCFCLGALTALWNWQAHLLFENNAGNVARLVVKYQRICLVYPTAPEEGT